MTWYEVMINTTKGYGGIFNSVPSHNKVVVNYGDTVIKIASI